MSLYYEAAEVLTTASQKGESFKSVVFSRKDWRTDRKTLFALTTEAARWSDVLSEVIEKSGILKLEKQLTPKLGLLLVHDLLLSKKGLALPQKHGLYTAVSRHKARLAAELTKVRLRRGCATLDDLRAYVHGNPDTGSGEGQSNLKNPHAHPRWIRINTLKTTVNEHLSSTFADYRKTSVLDEVLGKSSVEKIVYIDEHIPNLIAVPATSEIMKTQAYKEGKLILQDKASCFPAYLLDPLLVGGDIIDACAAPGNKTTHLAAIIRMSIDSKTYGQKVFAYEKDKERSNTLAKMIKLAGADDIVGIEGSQDFLKTNPSANRFANVQGILLDPSCSGSGIVGRDGVALDIHLPRVDSTDAEKPKNRKRKRNGADSNSSRTTQPLAAAEVVEEEPRATESGDSELEARLSLLSSFQLRLLEHAMAFPGAQRITYSTCSIHAEENEQVVIKALNSLVAVKEGWRIMDREEQVEGLRKWHRRGDLEAVSFALHQPDRNDGGLDPKAIAEACIRCDKGGGDGTMGFFVAGFVRDLPSMNGASLNTLDEVNVGSTSEQVDPSDNGTEEEWSGFSDEDER